MFTNCANNPIYIPNGGECDDCSQLENRVDNLEEAMTEVQEELPDKQDKLTAGEGIFITPDGIISTTGSSIKVEITGNDPYYSSDKTFSEILTAYNNGDTIVANYQGTALSLQSISQTEAVFASTDSDGNLTFFTITNSNDISSKTVDSVFLVTLTNPVGESGNKTYTSDRTLAEILEAIRNGSNVYATYSVANYPSYLALDWYTNDIVWFSSMSVDNASQQISAASVAQNRDYVATYHSVIHGVMQGASATRDGWSGIVPKPVAGDEEKFLKGDGTWAEVSGGCCAEEVSGNPIILTDAKNMNAQSLGVDFEPIQDLNGYDYAWAGGNGKNKLPLTPDNAKASNTDISWNNNVGTKNGITFTLSNDGIRVNGTATANIQFFLYRGLSLSGTYIVNGGKSSQLSVAVGGKGESTGNEFQYTDDGTNRNVWLYVANGATYNNVFVQPMIRLATESDATFAPYENICPISGAESVSVKRTGKNLFLPQTPGESAGIHFTVNPDGSMTINGTATGYSFLQQIGLLKAGTYTISGTPISDNSYPHIQVRKNDGDVFIAQSAGGQSGTFTLSEDTVVKFRVVGGNTNKVVDNVTVYPQLEIGSVATAYEPYIAQTVSINLGGEYYGGTLDFTTGELDVLWKAFTFDGSSDEEWSQEAVEEGTTPTWPLSHGIELEGVDATVKPYCSTYETKVGTVAESEWAMVGVYSPAYPANRTYLDVRPAVDYSTGNAWRDYLAANPLTVVAKLKEPIKVQLASAQLELLEKYNVLTTNGELITLGYMPDCYCGVTKASQLLGLTHIMDGKANGSLRSNTAFPDGVIERGGQSMDGTLGNFATALGAETMATGMGAFAHGMMTMASGTCAHAEGAGTAATGGGSHAEGEQTVASGARSHAEGLSNTASGSESHVGGASSEASAAGAFAHGSGLKASSPLQTVFGKYNVEDSNSEYAFIIGNGTSSNRSNLFAIKWDGTVEINGQALLPANGNSF